MRAVNKAHLKIKLMTQSLSLAYLLTHSVYVGWTTNKQKKQSTAFQSELISVSLLLFIGFYNSGFITFSKNYLKKSEKLTAFKKKRDFNPLQRFMIILSS